MSDLKIKNFKEFAIERLTEFEISPNSMYATKLALAYEEMSQEFKTAEYRLNYKVKELQSRITTLEKALEVSRECNRFYGDTDNWDVVGEHYDQAIDEIEGGKLARSTEKQIKEILRDLEGK